MAIQDLDQRFPIIDPKTGQPTDYFMRMLKGITGPTGNIQTDVATLFADKADKTIAITAGAGLDGGGTLAANFTIDANEQDILDAISSTRGTLLYRGASDWAGLAPGTSGHYLKTNGAADDPAWAAVSAGGAAWALAGTGQTATGVYDFAVDGAKANIDFIGLGSFNELLVIARDLTDGTTGQRSLRVSVDNGSTFYSASGDYISVTAAGVASNTVSMALHDTNSTAARTLIAELANLKGAVKYCRSNHTPGGILFVASALDINAVRVTNSGGGNITGGTVRVYAR